MRDTRVVNQLGLWGYDRGTDRELVRKVSFLLGNTFGPTVLELPRALLLIVREHLSAGYELTVSYLVDLLAGYGYYGDWQGGKIEQEQILALFPNPCCCLVAS